MEQKRLLLAFVISAAILFGWAYFVQHINPKPDRTATPSPSPANTATPSPQGSVQPNEQTAANVLAPVDDNVPQRTLRVSTPLYEVKFDTKGAVATSWIININKNTGRPLYSVASTKDNPVKLQLIPSESLRQKVSEAPFRVSTGDANLDAALASRTYRLEGVDTESVDAQLVLDKGETRQVNFVWRDEATGIEVNKSISFNADEYVVDSAIKVTRGGQPLPNVKLSIGPSIGDQGISSYSFYSVAPEGIASVGGKVSLYLGSSVHGNGETSDSQTVSGPVEWAGVVDTYFGMVAIPPKPVEGLAFRTLKYEHEVNGTKEERFLITAYLPIPSDGSITRLYVGPKDHYLLTAASETIARAGGPNVDLEGLINYGWLGFISRPLAVPILKAITYLYKLTNSYGLAIILFTIVIYSLFFPLKWRSSKAMKKAQKLAPRMKELQEQMKGMKQTDPRLRELQMEQLRMMKEGNPLGGCLPLLIQMPFLVALYSAITISIDFRQASFLWLPDLSAADPYKLLPILMAGSMVVLQFITPAPSADPLQRKMMAVVMPAFMLYILWSAPAGLLVYWIVGNIVGFSQQMIINRLIKSEDDEEPPQKNAAARSPKKLREARAS